MARVGAGHGHDGRDGLYIAPDCETVDPKWRGIGVRIEDDVLVTKTGHEVLTHAVPKAVDEIEALMAR